MLLHNLSGYSRAEIDCLESPSDQSSVIPSVSPMTARVKPAILHPWRTRPYNAISTNCQSGPNPDHRRGRRAGSNGAGHPLAGRGHLSGARETQGQSNTAQSRWHLVTALRIPVPDPANDRRVGAMIGRPCTVLGADGSPPRAWPADGSDAPRCDNDKTSLRWAGSSAPGRTWNLLVRNLNPVRGSRACSIPTTVAYCQGQPCWPLCPSPAPFWFEVPDRLIFSHARRTLLNALPVDGFSKEAFVPSSRQEYNRRCRLGSTRA
jgi:hypothetical protein